MEKLFNHCFKIITKNKIKTLSDISSEARTFAQNLKDKNLNEIEIYLSDTYEFIVALFGAFLAKNIVFILPKATQDSARFYINDDNFSDFLRPNTSYKLEKNIDLDSVFYLQTSGTQGKSKVILKTLNQMILEAQCISKHFDFNAKNLFFGSISHQHLYGLTFKIFTPLVSGATLKAKEMAFIEDVARYLNSTIDSHLVFISSPTFLKILANQNNLAYLKNIDFILSAGGKLESSIRQQLSQTSLIDIYGSTETGVVANDKGDGLRVFEDVKLKLDSKSNLIISSTWQKNIFDDKDFISNDCARFEGKNIVLLGRSDRIIKLHDKRIYLDEIESMIKKHSFISDCYVFKQDYKNRLSALITLSKRGKEAFKNNGKQGIVEAIKTYIKKDFGSNLRYFHLCLNLPYNAQGKLSKKDCNDLLETKITPKFTLLKQDSKSITAKSKIELDCFYFSGHFYSFPLVPGFVELGFVYELANKYLNIKTSQIKNIEHIKFSHFLRPLDTLQITLEIKNNKLYFTLFANDKECANGRMQINGI